MFSSPKVEQSGTSLHVTHGNDSNLYVEFEMVPVHQEAESNKEGRPIYRDVEFVTIMFPGDKTKKVQRPVEDNDRKRFPIQYQAFKNQEVQAQSGTPITEWPPITKSQALELKAMNIHTVEALSTLPDTALTWLGARELREKALSYLKASGDTAIVGKLTAENMALRNDLEALKRQMEEFSKQGKTKKEN